MSPFAFGRLISALTILNGSDPSICSRSATGTVTLRSCGSAGDTGANASAATRSGMSPVVRTASADPVELCEFIPALERSAPDHQNTAVHCAEGLCLSSTEQRPYLRTRAVVLFADLRGFTRIAERLSPDDVVALLNEYFALLVDITLRNGGTIFHMAGDCLLAGFGVPILQDDSAERAMRTARAMLDGFAGLAESWRRRLGIRTGLGIGIHEGMVIAANVGAAAYTSYTIIGDTVNVASRLCQRARAGEMLFSRSLKSSLDEHGMDVGALELPPMTLRGRTMPIDIYCVPLARRANLASGIA